MSLQSRYTLVRKIADGGMAEIFLAWLEGQRGFRKLVVLKRIRPAISASPQFRNMLVEEAHIAQGLHHGNIVQVLDLGEAGGRWFLALELVDGWSLEQLLTRARQANLPLPPELALYITAQVCRALAYAHAATHEGARLDIVHRDVSPQNILVSEQGEVKLTDFGIARSQQRKEHTATGVVKGKVSFMSPEQAQAAQLDGRSDLFSLGTVLYYLVTDKLPFQAATPLETMVLVQAGSFTPPAKVKPKLPSELNKLILHAMRTEPSERFQSAEDMLVAAEEVMRKTFAPVGQTELKRWLDELGRRDGVPPISRATGTEATTEVGAVVEVTSNTRLPLPPPPPREAHPASSVEAPVIPAAAPARRWRWAVPVALAAAGGAVWLASSLSHAPPPAPPAEPPAPTPQTRAAAEAPAAPAPVAPVVAPVEAADAGEAVAAAAADAGALALSVDAGVAADAGGVLALVAGEVADGGAAAVLAVGGVDAGVAVSAAPAADAGAVDGLPAGEAVAAAPPAEKAAAPATPRAPAMAQEAEAPAPSRPRTSSRPPRRMAHASSHEVDDGRRVSVLVNSVPAGATVRVGTRDLGTTPVPIRFRPGFDFEVTFLLDGYEPATKLLDVDDKEGQRITARLKRAGRRR